MLKRTALHMTICADDKWAEVAKIDHSRLLYT
jgi:hypothetical protein